MDNAIPHALIRASKPAAGHTPPRAILPSVLARLVCALLALIAADISYAQAFRGDSAAYLEDLYDIAGEFAFVRIQYDTYYDGGFYGGPWATDFPASDENFLRGVSRLTNVRVMPQPIVLRFDDEEIFDYPFLYALEMGRNGGLSLSAAEIENLREYLLRGGFLLIDDFWGERQWDAFYRDFSLVFPDRELIELNPGHEIYRTFYDIEGAQMIPGRGGRRGFGQAGIDVASNHAILDDDGRVMVLVNWNSDMGDGWEHTYDQWYPTQFSNSAYQLGINYLIYSLTH